MPAPPKKPVQKNVDEIDVASDLFSPEGDETRTIGGEAVPNFIREGNDIPLKKKKTLAQYLAAKTSVNEFPVTPDLYVESSATGPNGLPTPLTTKLPDFQTSFTNPNKGTNPFTGDSDPQNDLETYSNSGAGTSDTDAVSWVQENVMKGRGVGKPYNGHTLLRYVQGQEPQTDGKFSDPKSQDNVANNYTSKVLSHNRFTPIAPFSTQRDSAGKISLMRQTKFGVYDHDAPKITPEAADKIGSVLALRAAGELGAEDVGFNPPNKMNLRTILPGKTQLGISRVETAVLEAESVLRDIAGGVPTKVGLESSLVTDALSVGQINTYADPFSGLLPAGMSALAVALLLAAQIAIDVFSLLMNTVSTASSTSSKTKDRLGRYMPGKSYYNEGAETSRIGFPLPARLFGIEKTQNVYGEAVSKGIEVFFSVGLGRTIVEPGFFVVFLRSILASAPTLVRRVAEIFGSGNPFDIISSITTFIEAIRSSKLLAAMNVFAHIGDLALLAEDAGYVDNTRMSDIDALPSYLPGSAIAKSRDQDSLRLAWRTSASPMSVLLPATLRAAGSAKGLSRKLSGINRAYAGINTMHSPVGTSENRIPLDKLHALEARLEAEYVPFYFHDTRTNEIIAFHAFLTTLTDNYTTNHDTVDAYGRVDPIKIYKNTTRAINVSFHIVSTNEDDFDFMWAKINKLITLVYPQWSEGLVKRDKGGNSFTQPFSQVPAASPLFRLRVGDVIKSNYSRFALKRLFGYGSSNFSYKDESTGETVNEQSLRAEDKKSTDNFAAYRRAEGNLAGVSKQRSEIDSVRVGDNYLLRPAPLGGYPSRGLKTLSKNLKNRINTRVKVNAITLDNEVYVSDDSGSTFTVSASDLIELLDGDSAEVRGQNAASSKGRTDGLDKSFFSPGSNLGSGADPKANTIVRSFETAMSRGLPCVINSINFNWLEGTTWETEIFGSRAPKVVKVDLSITPFHDITPGLDAYGANRAPIYGVGQLSNAYADDDIEGEKQFERLRTSMWKRK